MSDLMWERLRKIKFHFTQSGRGNEPCPICKGSASRHGWGKCYTATSQFVRFESEERDHLNILVINFYGKYHCPHCQNSFDLTPKVILFEDPLSGLKMHLALMTYIKAKRISAQKKKEEKLEVAVVRD